MKHLSYEDEHFKAEIDIREATTGDGIRRTMLMYGTKQEDDLLKRSQIMLGNLLSAANIQTLTKDGEPFTVDAATLLDLPSALTQPWEMMVFDVNPQWLDVMTADQLLELQKKVRKPSSGSSTSTEPATKAKPKT